MNNLRNIILQKEQNSFRFKPDKSFYQQVGIRQKRWGLIFRGEICPTVSEVKKIANYFNVTINELID